MSTSLKQLQEYLVNTVKGTSGTHGYSSLNDLKNLVNNMITVRSGAPPASGSGSYSGVICTGHTTKKMYDSSGLSLGDIKSFSDSYLKKCTCDGGHTVKVAYCPSRTTCTCVSQNDTCACDWDECSCNSVSCTFNCDCRSVEVEHRCSCDVDDYGCDCVVEVGNECTCQSRTAKTDCEGKGSDADEWGCTFNCYCQNRSACGTVSVSCQCNARCTCNQLKTFS